MKIIRIAVISLVSVAAMIAVLVGAGFWAYNEYVRPAVAQVADAPSGGTTADATILEVSRTGMVVDQYTGLELLLEVHPPSDSTFRVRIDKAFLSPNLYLYEPGATVTVRYWPDDTGEVRVVSLPVREPGR